MIAGFDLKKLLKSPFTGIYWVKVVMILLGALAILSVGVGIYRFFFGKPEGSQAIIARRGSNVTVIQNNEKKRKFIPFVELSVGQASDHKADTAIRVGLRFEW